MKKRGIPITTNKVTTKGAEKITNLTANINSSHVLPIIGIGASAGGLEALQKFLENVPVKSGFAIVIIQHQDPTHKGIMVELLQRTTHMKVMQAESSVKVKSNCVYVIPPNKDLSILHGTLHLLDPIAPRGLRLPIDFFLRSLSNDQHEHAIGVILSGMGSDGTLGLRSIKENAGLSLVQEPSSAKFDGMPRSAIDAGLADIIAPVEELPGKILAYIKHAPRGVRGGIGEQEPLLELKLQSDIDKIIVLLRDHTGNDFSQYKRNTLRRRTERRMGLHQINSISIYVRYLRENPQELQLLFKELLIGVTNFFRDAPAWETLKNLALPKLIAAYPNGKAMRAWVPACSTGEEAFTLAIIFKETLEKINPTGKFSLQIFATDLDEDAINRARTGLFQENIVADVSQERLSRFFVQAENGGYQVSKEIREMIIFAPQNIIMDPPFTKLDILCCRNLLIYFESELQEEVIKLFYYALMDNGILMLGNAETIGSFKQFFTVIDNKMRLYQSVSNPLVQVDVNFPIRNSAYSFTGIKEHKMQQQKFNLQVLTDQLLLQHFAPSAVLVNAEGDILYINGRTGKYLEPASGKANWNIHAMARDGLRHELTHALKQSLKQSNPVLVKNLKVDGKTVNLTVQAINNPEALRGKVMVVFNDVVNATQQTKTSSRKPNAAYDAIKIELDQARDEIQNLHEAMQSSEEELKSSNEELQSTNEELQSANEELTTSKEELQSLNEELHSVNAELQSKVDDLSWVNNDMRNLLNSTEIATIFLDGMLQVRRFTTHATHLFRLIPSDVGRMLSDIATELDYPYLLEDVKEVIESLKFIEKQIPTKNNRWFKVRIMPYRTQEDVIDGVVITFIDITDLKTLEAKLDALTKK